VASHQFSVVRNLKSALVREIFGLTPARPLPLLASWPPRLLESASSDAYQTPLKDCSHRNCGCFGFLLLLLDKPAAWGVRNWP
jgi:hypothetical protein